MQGMLYPDESCSCNGSLRSCQPRVVPGVIDMKALQAFPNKVVHNYLNSTSRRLALWCERRATRRIRAAAIGLVGIRIDFIIKYIFIPPVVPLRAGGARD